MLPARLFEIRLIYTFKSWPFDFDKYDHRQVACSVCMKRRKVSTIMIPARNDCYGNWIKDYNGYLYTGHYTHSAASVSMQHAASTFI
jgi:hypothetical protein